MVFLIFASFFISFYFGFFFFSIRDKDFIPSKFIFVLIFTLTLFLSLFFNLDPKIMFSLLICVPLFISLSPDFLFILSLAKQRKKNFQTSIILLDLISLNLRTGLSFDESLRLALPSLPQHIKIKLSPEKNIVVQQPKSRFCSVFSDLEHDLNTVSQQNFRKNELLISILQKYRNQNHIETKIQISTTQYRVQSFVLLLFWICAAALLFAQGIFFKYKFTVSISFFLMLLGLFLAKKILARTTFRI